MMLYEISSAQAESAVKSLDWARLFEIVSIANRGRDSAQIVDAALDVLATQLPFQYAFALRLQAAPPRVLVEAPRNVPPPLRAALETLDLPADFIAVIDSPQGTSGLPRILERWRKIFDGANFGAPLFVPLTAEGRAIGLLVLGGPSHPEAQSEWAEQTQRAASLLEVVGKEIGVAIQRVRVEKQLRSSEQRRTRELELLRQLTVCLNKTIDMHGALDAALDIILALMGADAIVIFLIDKVEGHYDAVAHRGAELELVQRYGSMPFDRAIDNPEATSSLVEYLALTRRTLSTRDILAMPRFDAAPFRAAGYESFLALPMLFDQEVYGIVVLGSKRLHQFDAHSLQLGDSISTQLGWAIHSQRQVADLQRSIQQAQDLTRLGRMIQYAPRAEAALPAVVREIKRVLGADYVVVQLLRGNVFQSVTASDGREAPAVHPIVSYESQILESENPVVVNDRAAAQVDALQRDILRRLKLHATVAMRFYVHDHPLGILFVNQAKPREWRDDEIEFVRRAAQQIAYALENKRLLDEISQQVREGQTLAHVGRLVGGVVDPENALQSAADEIAQVLRADCVSLHVRHGAILQVAAESGAPDAARLVSIARYQHRILDDLDTVVINDRDAEREQIHPLQHELLARHGFVADLGVPLLYGAKALGVMYISQRAARYWTEAEILLAETFAQQIASGLENARLLQESRGQIRELRALARSANLIAKSRSAQAALPQIALDLRRALNADYAGFHLLEGDFLRVVTEPKHPATGMRYPLEPYHRLALENWQRMVVNDVALGVYDEKHRVQMERFQYKADIGVPMINRGKPLGFVFIAQNEPRAWRDSEIQLVETFAQQTASALDMVQVLEERQARVYELEQLAELNEITTTILDQDVLIDLALTALKELLNADQASVMLLEGEKFGPLRASDGRTFPGEAAVMTPRVRHVLDAKECFILDPKHPAEISPEARSRMEFYGTRALLSVPLVTANSAIGLLNFLFRTDHVFASREIQLAQTAASQLAMALGNARLLREQKTRVENLTQLANFSLACGAIHESAPLQKTAAKRICAMLRCKAVSIRLVENGTLTAGARHGYRQIAQHHHSIQIDGRLTQLLQLKKPYAISDLAHAPDIPDHWRTRHLEEGFDALLMIPMIAEHRVTGILTLFHGESHIWQEHELQYAQTIANTLALALSNVKEKENAERQSEELQATLDSVFSGVLATDAQGAIVSWNRKAEQVTGYAAREMCGKRWDVDGPRVGEAQRADLLILEAMADKQARFSLAARYFTRVDGRVIALREAATPLRDQTGRVRGAVCAFWDRTEEQEGERAKIDFINEVAHQLGNKLGSVIMSAEQLLRADLKDKTRERYIRVIADTAKDLDEFQTRFAAFQRERAQEGVVEAEIVLRAIVDEKLGPLRLREPKHNFRISGQFDLVLGDPQRLAVVVENLLDNAFKYSPPRSRITIHAALPKPDELWLTIHNKGAPIPPEVQSRLFERWQRGSAELPGNGLGLWLVRTKLHEMGGDICCKSTARRGTTFYVMLRRRAHQLGQTESDAALKRRSTSEGQDDSGKAKNLDH